MNCLFGYVADFEFAAADLFKRLELTSPGFVLWLGEHEIVGEFVIMTQLGFFTWEGDHYRIAIPDPLTLEQVQSAALRYMASKDNEYFLHPETLLRTMPIGDARRALQRKEAARIASREVQEGDEPKVIDFAAAKAKRAAAAGSLPISP